MDLQESISNQTDISLTLSKHVFSNDVNKGDNANMVFSPLSIHVVLGLIASGSNGPTRDQLLSFLKSKSVDEVNSLASQLVDVVFVDGSAVGGPRLSVANSVWVEQTLPLKHSFKQIVDNVYKAASESVDFQNKAVEIASQVNQWAENKTSGLIKEILPAGSVDSSTRLVFANALYFKGAWDEKFDASVTKESEFHLLNGTSIQVPFMTSKKKQYVKAFDGFKVLGLPYKQGEDRRRFSMYFFLPDANDGLPALVDKVSSESRFLERHLPYQKVGVGEFRIPKFKISFGFEASNVLKGLGVVLPFSGDGLTEMVESPVGSNLYVSNIFHKSFIEVNEEGTEAAAATACVVKERALMVDEKVDFVADHPYLFLIREDVTGVVLFVGSVLNPLAE
ncbi:Serpin-ZX [Capsicum chinense]|nr:Serpin-ZX [Capsicum chinense]